VRRSGTSVGKAYAEPNRPVEPKHVWPFKVADANTNPLTPDGCRSVRHDLRDLAQSIRLGWFYGDAEIRRMRER